MNKLNLYDFQINFLKFLFMLLIATCVVNCQDECGLFYRIQNVKRLINGSKIVNGIEATQNSWPSQALIVHFPSRSMCGGTLIKRNVVLTAAHCVLSSIGSEYSVYLGVHDRSKLNSDNTVKVRVNRIVRHHLYDKSSSNVDNDIGLMILEQNVDLNKRVQLACLPKVQSDSYPNANLNAWVVGWGATQMGGSSSTVLKNARIRVLDGLIRCNKFEANWAKQICASEASNQINSCNGDSGGPLFILDNYDNKIKYVQVGIVSYGSQLGCTHSPGVYTRTAAYLDWIKANCSSYSSLNLNFKLFLVIYFFFALLKCNIN